MTGVQSVAEMERLLDREEVAALLGCTPRTLGTMWRQDRFLPPFYVSGYPRWRMKDVVAWIDATQAKTQARNG